MGTFTNKTVRRKLGFLCFVCNKIWILGSQSKTTEKLESTYKLLANATYSTFFILLRTTNKNCKQRSNKNESRLFRRRFSQNLNVWICSFSSLTSSVKHHLLVFGRIHSALQNADLLIFYLIFSCLRTEMKIYVCT